MPTAHWQWQIAAVRSVHQYNLSLTLNWSNEGERGRKKTHLRPRTLWTFQTSIVSSVVPKDNKAAEPKQTVITPQNLFYCVLKTLFPSLLFFFCPPWCSQWLHYGAVGYRGFISSQRGLQRLWLGVSLSAVEGFLFIITPLTVSLHFQLLSFPPALVQDRQSHRHKYSQQKKGVYADFAQSQLWFLSSLRRRAATVQSSRLDQM